MIAATPEHMEIALTIAITHQRIAEKECGYDQDSELVVGLQKILNAIENGEPVQIV